MGSSIFAIKTHQNYTCCFCYHLPPKMCTTNALKYVNFLDLVYIHASWQHCMQL